MSRFRLLLDRANVQTIVEVLLLWGLVTLGYLHLLEPVLQSVAPDVYVQSGLEYGRYELPDTPTELTHSTLSVLTGLPYYYWRLNYTELGARAQESIDEFEGRGR